MQKRHADDDIAQAARLYYVDNLSQQEVSARLGISRFKVLRMLADAREQGLVRIAVEHRTSRTLDLAGQLVSTFGLQEVQIAPIGTATMRCLRATRWRSWPAGVSTALPEPTRRSRSGWAGAGRFRQWPTI